MKKQESEERRQEFEALVATGMSVAKAAAAVGISTSTGFVWAQPSRRPARKGARKTMRFAQLVPRTTVEKQMQLEVDGVVIKVESTFDDQMLARLIRVLRGAS